MEHHSVSFEDDDQIEPEGMEDHSNVSQDDEQIEPEGTEDHSVSFEDDVTMLHYLNMMINNRKSCPNHFLRDENARVYKDNPYRFFDYYKDYKYNHLVFVKRRTEACGKTDGCESGCWRIMARDIVIKNEETGEILGLKKILKFCENKEKKRPEEQEETLIWVMEEYRLVDKWKQDQVTCRIRLLSLGPEVMSLLAKHFSFLIPTIPKPFLPRRDPCAPRLETNDEMISYFFSLDEDLCLYYLEKLVNQRKDFPNLFLQSEQVYGVVPWSIVGVRQSSVQLPHGIYFFVGRRESSGRPDGCDGGCWRIMKRDRVIKSQKNKILGFKRIFKFCEKVPPPDYEFSEDKDNEVKVTWVMEEYRPLKKMEQGKVICRITLLFPTELHLLI